jgi:hypothetical protein
MEAEIQQQWPDSGEGGWNPSLKSYTLDFDQTGRNMA